MSIGIDLKRPEKSICCCCCYININFSTLILENPPKPDRRKKRANSLTWIGFMAVRGFLIFFGSLSLCHSMSVGHGCSTGLPTWDIGTTGPGEGWDIFLLLDPATVTPLQPWLNGNSTRPIHLLINGLQLPLIFNSPCNNSPPGVVRCAPALIPTSGLFLTIFRT